MREGTTQRARSRALRRAPRPYVGRRSPWWRRAWSRLGLQAAPARFPVLHLDDGSGPAAPLRHVEAAPDTLPADLGVSRPTRPRAVQHAG